MSSEPVHEPMHRGDQIRQARETIGWTQAHLAERVSVTARTVRNWELTGSVSRRKLTGIDNALRIRGVDTIYRDDYPAAVRLAAVQEVVPYVVPDGAARAEALQLTDAYQLASTVVGPAIAAHAQFEHSLSILTRLEAMRAAHDQQGAELDQIITELGGEPRHDQIR